ncbi:hypothetical protein pb186bvf_014029 [Paramecium bursaria]
MEKDYKIRVARYAKLRQAQQDLQDSNISVFQKYDVAKELQDQFNADEQKEYIQLLQTQKNQSYVSTILAFAASSIIPRAFRSFRQFPFLVRCPAHLILFVITQQSYLFPYLASTDTFHDKVIEKYGQSFLGKDYS